jgi:alpha-L-rhamnosidase
MKRFFAALCLASSFLPAADTGILTRPWRARWISVNGAPPFDYGVYHFRRAFDLPSKPASFKIHVTADNRYQLFVNGEQVGVGPARGDVFHWRYETYDIAQLLKPGKNVLAAVVWNAGAQAPMAQVTVQTGFLLAGDGEAERIADTGATWKCIRNEAYEPEAVTRKLVPYGYYVAGPGDRVTASRYPWGWERPEFNDSAWKAPAVGQAGGPRDSSDSPSRWMLVPRPIPMPEMKPERLARVRLASGVKAPAGFPAKPAPLTIPARTKAELLLDQDYLTTAYPELEVSGGTGAVVTIGYAEALFVPGTNRKDNRNEVEGKQFLGYQDVFIADGGARRVFRPLWWRTYRYVRLAVETKDAPLTINDFRGVYTGYPFERKARFDAASDELQKMLDTGWRTARLCAHETYIDCPYYEQLQYAGDTRIQALVSLYMTGDGRLVRNAIEQLDSSRTSEGATYSRAPSRLQQYIPGFSLWWIGMLHDYWMYQDDPVFVKQMLPGVRAVLSFFASYQKPNASLANVPWWNFEDWTREWRNGVPPAGPAGSSAPADLQLLLAYQWAARMEESLGSKALAEQYDAAAAELRAAVRNLYWDADRKLFADTTNKSHFSQHSQALAVLAGVTRGKEARELIERAAEDKSLVACSIYFRYYLHAALAAAGAGDRYLDMLDEWRGQLSRGLTTWAEMYEPSRSDCHAWGASPNVELFRTVLGIDSAAPGFRRVVVRPSLGKLTKAAGAIPHPKGEVAVSLVLQDGKLEAEVTLPPGVDGELVWQGKRQPLVSGPNKVSM